MNEAWRMPKAKLSPHIPDGDEEADLNFSIKLLLEHEDYEYSVQTSETLIEIAATRLILNRLASA
jgi:hypothetical protein